ncbi:MAG: restriction endonuclease subunit S, partial [Planctomycetes bacterium]|nr:restriction endonuclease subunit S [Planctomycetota bacterium]
MSEATPTGWVQATLGDVLSCIDTGSSFRCEERPPQQSEIGVVKVSAVTWGTYDEQESKTCTDPDRVDLATLVKPGDFLFSRANTIELIGACVIAERVTKRIMLSDKILRFDIAGINPRWVLWYLRSPNGRAEIQRLSTGNQMSMRNIGQERIRQIPLPISPSSESERILDALDERLSDLDASVASLERAERNLVRYRAAVLAAACSGRLVPTEADLARRAGRSYEPADQLLARILAERRKANTKAKYEEPAQPDTGKLPKLPEGWTTASLEQLTSAVRPICYGILMPKENVQTGVLFVKVKDMKGDKIDLAGLHRTTPEIAAQYARASLRTGDLLLSIRGTFGRVAEVPKELDGGNITQDTARLDVTSLVDHRYVATCLRSPISQERFKRVARGVAVKGVNIGDVRPAPIPLPPIAEQARIVAEVDRHLSRADALAASITQSKRRAQRLRRAILAAAFQGRLVPQDPHDEPASALLERIRAQTAVRASAFISLCRRFTIVPQPELSENQVGFNVLDAGVVIYAT